MKIINLFTSIIILLFLPMLFACNNIPEISNTITESTSISLSAEVSSSESNNLIKEESTELGEYYSEVESEKQVEDLTQSSVVATPTPKPTTTPTPTPTQIIKPATPSPIIFSPENDFTYTVSNGSATVTGYTGQEKTIVIPKTLGGNPVTVIGNFVFADYRNLTSVIMPESIKIIGNYAFVNCSSLINFEIPENVIEIGDSAFGNCTGLTNITIPDNVLTLGERAFGGCRNLENITISKSITSIEPFTFERCENLINITIPDKITSIGMHAFINCSNLKTINLGKGLSSIVDFNGCNSLSDINIDINNPNYKSIDGVLFNKNVTILEHFPAGKTGSYAVPEGIKNIGVQAFYGSSLTNVIIPNSVAVIESMAFLNSKKLSNISFGSSIEKIEYGAFWDCSNLSEITLPDSVNTLGDRVFENCSKLTKATFLGNAPQQFGTSVFQNCSPDFTIYFNKGASGFSVPLWNNYPAALIGDE